jgi:hypothetical protein
MALLVSTSKQVANFVALVSDAIDTSGATLLAVCMSGYDGEGTYALTDSKGNTWVKRPEIVPVITGDPYVGCFFYCLSPTVGSGHTFTNTGQTNGTLFVAAFDNDFIGFDAGNGNAAGAGATSISTGSITPFKTGELFIAAVTNDNGAGVSIDSSFVEISDTPQSAGTGGAIAYKIGSASAENPTWTAPAAGGRGRAAALLAFKVVVPTVAEINGINKAAISEINNKVVASIGEINNVAFS